MVVGTLVQSLCNALKAIQVELTLEGGQFGNLAKIVTRQQVTAGEFLGLMNDEAATMRLPGNNVTKAIGFDTIQHFLEFDGKGGGFRARIRMRLFQVGERGHIVGMIVVVVMDNQVLMTFGRHRARSSTVGLGVADHGDGLGNRLKGSRNAHDIVVVVWYGWFAFDCFGKFMSQCLECRMTMPLFESLHRSAKFKRFCGAWIIAFG
mmetsp:Transcript_21176/g.44266  ORF Transcript_21176/g.44266 Transcript_21176/m.44266 type:complete len:206 (-) Transcript_21176:138-755(-)